ncbi:MAG TPA: DNA cytosine methyltransferase [Bacteroidia bacterium]|jgi:site-specific DNA-cytosine methylase|nr:DNA cytosine methyltransferase [Bacteroidia bacterium]
MTNEGINVLSLFDGVSTAFIALQRAGIPIKNYYSSEIDKSALMVQNHHYSANTKFHQIGDVRNVDGIALAGKVSLVVFGSPCTQLSSINPLDRSGLKGPDSSLFYEAIRIMKELKFHQPSNHKLYFLCENVQSMARENRDIITKELKNIFGDEVKMLKIDSAILAPSHRRRLYWNNFKATIPKPNTTKYQDVLVNGYAGSEKANVILTSSLTLTNGLFRHFKRRISNVIYKNESFAKLPTKEKLEAYPAILKESGYIAKADRNKDEYKFLNGCYRLPSVLELERMMTFDDGYISDVAGISRTEKQKLIGLSFTADVVSHLLNSLPK